MKKGLLSCVLSLTLAGINAQSPGAETYDATVANHYFGFSLKLVKESPGFSPPVASRAFGYMGLALYESVVNGISDYHSSVGVFEQFNYLTPPSATATYHWPTVANNALAVIIDSLFGTATEANIDSLEAIRDSYNNTFQGQLSTQVFNDSKNFGVAIANDVFEYSKTDNGHACYSNNFPPSYVPPVGPGMWEPFGPQVCMQPYWGSNRPFLTEDTMPAILPIAPPPFSEISGSEFYEYADEVYQTVNNLTPAQLIIAQYWADGGGTVTPPGHSISILRNILILENKDLAFAAVAYAKMGIGQSDAFLACWRTKYIYNLCRPVTYIRSHIDSTWVSVVSTPPFPEYTSGHSTQSGAMAQVMENLFGTNYGFTDYTHGSNFGGPRTFPNFDAAANEAAVSRLYGGIHYTFSNERGLITGRAIGQNIINAFNAMNTSSVQNKPDEVNLELFPNPATSYFMVKTTSESNMILEIVNPLGQKLQRVQTTGMVDVSGLPDGLYFVNLMDDNKLVSTSRLIVKH